MNPACRSGWFGFAFGLAFGGLLTCLAGTEVAATYWRGLPEIRLGVWAVFVPIWLAGGLTGLRAHAAWQRRRGRGKKGSGGDADLAKSWESA